jgi:hypothetical protein
MQLPVWDISVRQLRAEMYVTTIRSFFHSTLPVKEIKKYSEKAQFLVVTKAATTTYCGPLVGRTKVRCGIDNKARQPGIEDL